MGKVRKAFYRVSVLCIAVLISSASFATIGLAQSVGTLDQRREQLFSSMLSDPANLDLAFEYAALSVQAGDLEGAISTLERMLIFSPGLPRLQLELGVLYYRLGSYDSAHSYFQAVLDRPDVPPEVIENVRLYEVAIEKAGAPQRFSGVAVLGTRYQTNANLAPLNREINLNGLPFLLNPANTAQPDFNVYGALNLHYTHDLQSQGDLFEADLTLYGAGYADLDNLNILLGELTAGPVFNMNRFGIPNTLMGVYGIINGINVGGDFYSHGAGGGVRLVSRPNFRTSINLKAEVRQRWYENSVARPLNSDRDGVQFKGIMDLDYLLNSKWTLLARLHGDTEQTNRDYHDHWEAGGSVGLRRAFQSPLPTLPGTWSVTGRTGIAFRDYGGPDPTINPTLTQHDREFFVSGGLVAPIKDNFSWFLDSEFRVVDSNYDTSDLNNFSVSTGIIKRF